MSYFGDYNCIMCGISHICLFHFAIICFLSLSLLCVWTIAAAFILLLSPNVYSLGQYSYCLFSYHQVILFLSMFLKYIFPQLWHFLFLWIILLDAYFFIFSVYKFFHFSKSVNLTCWEFLFLSRRWNESLVMETVFSIH